LKLKRYLIFGLFFLIGNKGIAQSDTTWKQKPTTHISGFMDIYYAYDFNKPQSDFRQPFLFNHNRHDEINLNLGFTKLSVEHVKYRANLAIHVGTYSNDNYAAEPGLLKNIFEANMGISLNKKNKLWLDAGVMPSHIGFESAISSDNWTLTRSLLAENSPYFLTGAKLTYNPNVKWELAGLILNGWQRIKQLQGNSMPSFGTQVNFSPSDKITLNWSTFIGTDDPDTTRRMRVFNNFYGQFQFSKKYTLIAGFDIGFQQRIKSSTTYDLWFSPVIIGQYNFNKNWKTAIRAEYYQDETGIIIPTNNINGFRTSGISLNVDYSPTPNVICRIEGRALKSKDNIFQKGTGFISDNLFIVTSIAILFDNK
jgi:hypothetical protein